MVNPKGIVLQEIAFNLFRQRLIFWTIFLMKWRLKIGCVCLELDDHIRIFFDKNVWCSIPRDIMIGDGLDGLLMSLLITRGITRYVTFWIDIIAFRMIGWFVKGVLWFDGINMNLILECWRKAINQARWFYAHLSFQRFRIDLWWVVTVYLRRIGTVSDVCFDFWVSFLIN